MHKYLIFISILAVQASIAETSPNVQVLKEQLRNKKQKASVLAEENTQLSKDVEALEAEVAQLLQRVKQMQADKNVRSEK